MAAKTSKQQKSRAPTIEASKRLDYLPGSLIIRFREEAVGAPAAPQVHAHMLRSAASMTVAMQAMPESVTGPIDYLRNNLGLAQMRPLFADPVSARFNFAGIKAGAHKAALVASVAGSPSEELRGYIAVSLDTKEVTAEVLKRIGASRGVQFVERMPARWLAAPAKDPMQGSQWGLHAIGWFDRALPNARQVSVAVLDTGVDATHPDLKSVILDYDHGSYSAEDIVGHGTHVCGIIAAILNNNVGISGVAQTRLKVWKIFPDKPTQGDYYVDGERYLRTLREVENSGARVLNLSIGGGAASQTEALLFRRLARAEVSVVAAMGNEYQDGNPVEYPGAYPDVIAVGAVDPRLERASFSNTGAHIHVVAPGVSILSTLPMKKSTYRKASETRYASWDGTSMATPHVAGGLALLLAKTPKLDAGAVRARLQARAKKPLGMKGKNRTNEYGYGLLYLPNLLK